LSLAVDFHGIVSCVALLYNITFGDIQQPIHPTAKPGLFKLTIRLPPAVLTLCSLCYTLCPLCYKTAGTQRTQSFNL